jgi:hypothetical protein
MHIIGAMMGIVQRFGGADWKEAVC